MRLPHTRRCSQDRGGLVFFSFSCVFFYVIAGGVFSRFFPLLQDPETRFFPELQGFEILDNLKEVLRFFPLSWQICKNLGPAGLNCTKIFGPAGQTGKKVFSGVGYCKLQTLKRW